MEPRFIFYLGYILVRVSGLQTSLEKYTSSDDPGTMAKYFKTIFSQVSKSLHALEIFLENGTKLFKIFR